MTALLQDLWWQGQGLLGSVPEREGHHPAAHAHTATVQLWQECLKTALRKEQQACSIQEADDPAQLRDLGIHASLRLGTTPARLETHYHTPLQAFRRGGRTARSNGFDLQRQLDLKDPPLHSNMLESQRKSAGGRQESTVADLRRMRDDRHSLGLLQRRAGKSLKGGR